MLDRRRFLIRGGLGLASATLAGVGRQADEAAADRWAAQPNLGDWGAVRDLFDLTRDQIHLGGFLLASHPTPVREAIDVHRRGLDSNPVRYLRGEGPRLEAQVLRSAAQYLVVDPADIALTDSTTMGLGLLYNGLRLSPEQEVLTTVHDYYATRESLGYAAARSGAVVRTVSLYDRIESVSEDAIVAVIRGAISPRTRVVALTWVHSSTGLKLPIRRIADVVSEANRGRDQATQVLMCVDGVHGFGVEDVTMADLGCDFFVAGCHKWLFGPRGTGLVWGQPDAWSAAAPTIPTFSDAGTPGGQMTPGGYHSFEHRWALSHAFELHLRIGKARVAARVHDLNRQLKEGLAGMGHVTLYTPLADELSAGLVCFDVRGMTPATVVRRLGARQIIATVTPYAVSHARVAPGLLNTPEEIETTLREIRALA